MKKRPSVYDLHQMKGKKKFLQLHVDDAEEAGAAEAAGIEILSCESDQTLVAIRAAAPRAFISAGLPNRTIVTGEDGIRLGFDALNRGADAVYCSSSPKIIEAMAREGIPVTGHVGLVPNHSTWTSFGPSARHRKKRCRSTGSSRNSKMPASARWKSRSCR